MPPTKVTFSPDGSLLTFLDGNERGITELFGLDMRSLETRCISQPIGGGGDTEGNLSLEEKLRRERQRQVATGITDYQWFPTEPFRVLIPQQGSLYVHDSPMAADSGRHKLRLLFDKSSTGQEGSAIDPKISPDGKSIAFVQNNEVYVMSADGDSRARQLTHGARGTGKTHGLADFIAQEEMHRFTGFWWSPDSKMIAFEEVDESHIPQYRILHQGREEVSWEEHRYPFAGAANPKFKLGVMSATDAGDESASVVWADLGEGERAEYLARVHWLADGSLIAEVETRDQQELRALRVNVNTGASTELLTETSKTWINLNELFTSLPVDFVPADDEARGDGVYFLWGSERSGFCHVYLYFAPADGSKAVLVKQLTSGSWVVESVDKVDVPGARVFVSGTAPGWGALERQCYVVPLSCGTGATASRVTTLKGTHVVALNSACTRAMDTFSTLTTPSTMQLLDLTPISKGAASAAPTVLKQVYQAKPAMFKRVLDIGAEGTTATEATGAAGAGSGAGAGAGAEASTSTAEPESKEGSWLPSVAPELVSLACRDGTTTLYGALWRPDAKIHGPGPYPAIISVYGGPGVQRVKHTYRTTSNARPQRFRDLGFAVFQVDNRGSSRRGVEFEAPIMRNMGTVEVDDQVDAVSYLVEKGIADPKRVGIYGWSYGGYMTLLALCKAPHVFACGVSGAPVTHWDGYDTHYTERFMGTPASNPDGYCSSSVMEHVGGLKGQLMLIHGLIDENVHFRHTARLIHALIKARKRYELFLLPDERHGPRSPADRDYVERVVQQFFRDRLGGSDSKL